MSVEEIRGASVRVFFLHQELQIDAKQLEFAGTEPIGEAAPDNLELWAVYFDVPADGVFRLDAPDPGNCVF